MGKQVFFEIEKQAAQKGAVISVFEWSVQKFMAQKSVTKQQTESKKDEEKLVLGVVLEPNDGSDGQGVKPDTDNEVYSAEEVRKAAHWYMEFGKKKGLLHGEEHGGEILDPEDDRIVVVESFLTPIDIPAKTYGPHQTQPIKKGTWIMGFRVNDDKVWESVKAGRLNGLSIGGQALQSALED